MIISAMLRIQKSIPFKDPVGREYTTDALLLTLRDQTAVYTVDNNSRDLFVYFAGEPLPTESQIRTLTGNYTDDLARHHILWPKLECCHPDTDMLCGFLASRIDLAGDVDLIRDLIPVDVPDPDTAVHNLKVGLNLAKCIRAVHQAPHRLVLGTVEPDDFHVDADGKVFSCYAYRNSLVPAASASSLYFAPECIAEQRGFTQASDAFSFALILFELLTGSFPFGAHDPDAMFDSKQITDMILNGESIYYYANTDTCRELDGLLARISPVLPAMFRLAFDYCGRSQYDELRPSMADWIHTLEQITVKSADPKRDIAIDP